MRQPAFACRSQDGHERYIATNEKERARQSYKYLTIKNHLPNGRGTISTIEKSSAHHLYHPPAIRDEVIPGLYIREIKSCVCDDHQSHISTRIGPRACVRTCIAYVRACDAPRDSHAAVVFRFHRANHHPDGERAPHGWKRLTCKLRARSEPATRDRTHPIWIVVRARCTIDSTTPVASDPVASAVRW